MAQNIKIRQRQLKAFTRLLDIMDELREKCPWDKKQTLESLTRLTIEEVYETVEAIRNKNYKELEGELGDLFLHLVFYSKIGSETNKFTLESVLDKICEKLIFRHPHIYSDKKAIDEETVKQNWEKLKIKEGKSSVLEGLPRSLPALIKAQRIQDKVAGVGFDFDDTNQILNKIIEEIEEMQAERNPELKKKEFGDILFSLVNLARFIGIDAEESLSLSSNQFIKRFVWIEKKLEEDGTRIDQVSDKNLLEAYWVEAKKMVG